MDIGEIVQPREFLAQRIYSCSVCRQPIKECSTVVTYPCLPCSQGRQGLLWLMAHKRCHEFLKEQEAIHGA